MLYRPNFCCHCGEKIARARWTPLTSRRFCEFCEIEQQQHELLPKALIGVAFLVGAAGLTAYIGGNGNAERKSTAQVREFRSEVKTPTPVPPSNLTQGNRY